MENNLIKINSNNSEIMVIDTREIAEMMGIEHKLILKKLEGTKDGKTKGIIPIFNENKIALVDYFIESTYVDNKGENRKCYLCTKMGCEFLANKFTGEKGILFTAKYVKRFNEMENQMTKTLLSFQIEDPIERAKAWIKEQEESRKLLAEKDEIIEELSPLAELARKRIDNTGTASLTDVTKTFNLKRGQITSQGKDKGYIHKTIKEVNKAGEDYFKVVCGDGIHKGIAITEEGIKFVDKNLDEIKTYPSKFKLQNN